MGTETNRSMTVRLALEPPGTCADRSRTNSATVAKNMATESPASDQASQEAARGLILSTPPSSHFGRGPQPQRGVGRLHRLPHHAYQLAIQRLEVRLIPQFGGEAFERLPRIVLLAVEAPIHESLHPAPQRAEQRRDGECGSDDGQGGLLAVRVPGRLTAGRGRRRRRPRPESPLEPRRRGCG